MRVREVHGGFRLIGEVARSDISDDADHRHPQAVRVLSAEPEPPVERTFVAPDLSRQSFAHDRDERRSRTVGVGEVTALLDSRSHGGEPARCDFLRRGGRRLSGRKCLAVDYDVPRATLIGDRQPPGRSDSLRAAHRAQPRLHVLVELDYAAVAVAGAVVEGNLCRERAGGVEAHVLALHVNETAHEHAGAAQQHHRQRDLGHDKRVTRPRGTPPGTRALAGGRDGFGRIFA